MPQFLGMTIVLTDKIMHLVIKVFWMDVLVNTVLICASTLRNDDSIDEYNHNSCIERIQQFRDGFIGQYFGHNLCLNSEE